MSPATEIAASKERLREGRERLSRSHQQGTPGIQVCTQLTDLLDDVLMSLLSTALEAVDDPEIESLVALVGHGGYGRRDVAPFSDVDLMLLHVRGSEARVAPLARQLTHRIYDCGLDLGFSLRTISQACQLAVKDATVFTSLVESRFLAGSHALFQRYMARFRRVAARRSPSLVEQIAVARRAERTQYGETEFLLEPNVKRSRGGLRELQLLRWIGFAVYGEPEPKNLEQLGVLHPEDRRRLRGAREFLLRLRNELHFHAGRAQDVLGKGEQLRLAQSHGFAGSEGVLPVEQFMREYFEHTSEVRHIVKNFVHAARPRSLTQVLYNAVAGRRIGPDYHLGPQYVRATDSGLEKLRGDLVEVLQLMELANLAQRRIHPETWKAIREAMIERERIDVSPVAAERFLALISSPGELGSQLRRLHQLRVLEKLIPPLAHARCLLQFNEYHKYTVDEHSLRAVEAAADLIDAPGPLGDAYRGIRQKRTLHLALLLHDLGKGYTEDHSEIGRRLAAETALHLNLPERERETVEFLVHKHLRMPHLAFRQNLDDDSVIVRFAVEVGSPSVLQMLYVLSCADLAAVGPGVLNDWKLELLTQLYLRTRRHLTDAEPSGEDWTRQRRDQIRQSAPLAEDPEWWSRQIDALPSGYLFCVEPPQIVNELQRLRNLQADQVDAWGSFLPERNAVEYTVAARDDHPGIFHKLTGALTAAGAQILSAEIHTLADRLVLDRFYVDDIDFQGSPPPERIEDVCRKLIQAASDPSDQPPVFRTLWAVADNTPNPHPMPNKVNIDNSTSDTHTIVAVFAYDRMGLLYRIARALYELRLSVEFAKIATYIDQVVDVFYVKAEDGGKVVDPEQLNRIRQHVLQAVTDSADS